MIRFEGLEDVRFGGNEIHTVEVKNNGQTKVVWKRKPDLKIKVGYISSPLVNVDDDDILNSIKSMEFAYYSTRDGVEIRTIEYTTEKWLIKQMLSNSGQWCRYGDDVSIWFDKDYIYNNAIRFFKDLFNYNYGYNDTYNITEVEFNGCFKVQTESYYALGSMLLNSKNLKRCKLPDVSFWKLNYSAFSGTFDGCDSLEEVEFGKLSQYDNGDYPNEVVEIIRYCFEGCENLKRIYIPHDFFVTSSDKIYDQDPIGKLFWLNGFGKLDVYITGEPNFSGTELAWYNTRLEGVDKESNPFWGSNFYFKDGIRQGNNQFWNSNGTINSY